MLGTKQIIVLTAFVLILSAGQVLFKQAAVSVPAIDRLGSLVALPKNPWLWAVLILYGVAVVLWVVILQKMPLSTAYPFTALCFIIVPLAAAIFFKEPYSVKTLFGGVLILGGVYLSALR